MSVIKLLLYIFCTTVFFFCVDLPALILGLIMVPIGLLFCNKDSQHMPKFFYPWDNDRDGINGDGTWDPTTQTGSGWKGPEHTMGNYTSFWNRFRWLALRNPTNNFDYTIGFPQTSDLKYTYTGNPNTSDAGTPGLLVVYAKKGPITVAYAFYLVYRYPFLKTRCLRLFFGWKIQDNVFTQNFYSNLGTKAQFVFVPNPLMTFKPKV